MTFLTVVTRTCRRPQQLERNIESLLLQDDPDWEQLLLVDRTGRHDIDPILWANEQFGHHADLVRGQYVYMLDDDCYLVDRRFVSKLKRKAVTDPDLILVKTNTRQIDGKRHIYPARRIWNLKWECGRRPKKWSGSGSCVVVKRHLWQQHIPQYHHTPGGDWYFVTSLLDSGVSVVRLNVVVMFSASGRGCGVLFEKCDHDWFDTLKYHKRLTHLRHDAWVHSGTRGVEV